MSHSQTQSAAKPYLAAMAAGLITLDFVNRSNCEIPRNAVTHALVAQIYDLGSKFYGCYQVHIGDEVSGPANLGITWLDHKLNQRGFGFTLGPTEEGSRRFKSRRYSLVPPDTTLQEELYRGLAGKQLPTKPPLVLVSDKPKPPPPTAVPQLLSVAEINANLANAHGKVQGLRARLAAAQAEEEQLSAEVLLLEARAAQASDVEALALEQVRILLGR